MTAAFTLDALFDISLMQEKLMKNKEETTSDQWTCTYQQLNASTREEQTGLDSDGKDYL